MADASQRLVAGRLACGGVQDEGFRTSSSLYFLADGISPPEAFQRTSSDSEPSTQASRHVESLARGFKVLAGSLPASALIRPVTCQWANDSAPMLTWNGLDSALDPGASCPVNLSVSLLLPLVSSGWQWPWQWWWQHEKVKTCSHMECVPHTPQRSSPAWYKSPIDAHQVMEPDL